MSPISKKYLIIFFLFSLGLSPIIFLGETVLRIADCNPNPALNDNFLAYCWKKSFADYEHGAYWLPTEPKALQAVKEADILILGNSRAQHAFSTQALDTFSSETGIKHYVLGFAGEGFHFAESLLTKQNITPKILVLNLDTIAFFDHPASLTKSAQTLYDKPLSSWVEYKMKWLGQQIQRSVCVPEKQIPLKEKFCGKEDTIYRSTITGHWQTSHRDFSEKHVPIFPANKGPEIWDLRKDAILSNAVSFAKRMKEKNICIFTTNVPAPKSFDPVAQKQSSAMLVPFLLPHLPNPESFDNNHLDKNNAEEFSAQFLQLMTPYLKDCL